MLFFFSACMLYHPSPDLNLASSYIPACLCVVKCALAFVLFVLSPIRGWIGLCCFAIVDRLLWNNTQTMIIDVNSVVVSLVGGLMVVHARASGVHGLTHLAVIALWMMVSAPQITGISRLQRGYEVLLAGACVAVLSCMFQAQDRPEILALRVFVFVLFNTGLPYIGILMQQQLDTDSTYVNVCRTLLILLGEPEIACLWVVVYIICLGYNLRAVTPPLSNHGNSKRIHDYVQDLRLASSTSCTPAFESEHTIAIQSKDRFDSDPSSSDDPSTLLREALANRRGFVREGPA